MHYHAELAPTRPDGLARIDIRFGEPADNSIVPDAIQALASLNLPGGRGVLFNGAASLPAAMALAHAVAHLYQLVACREVPTPRRSPGSPGFNRYSDGAGLTDS